jgi:hypothetical protein
MAILKSRGNTIPMAESSDTSLVLFNISVKNTVITPIKAAPTIKRGEVKLFTIKNPITIPNKIVWVIASDIIDIFLRTKNTPGREHATATITAMI